MNSLTLLRNGKKLFPLAWLSTDDIEAGHEARALIDLWRPLIQRTDAIAWNGIIDFGPHYVFKMPECGHTGPALPGERELR